MARRIPKDQKARIIFLHETEGLDARALSQRFGYSIGSVKGILSNTDHTKTQEIKAIPKITGDRGVGPALD